MKKLLILLLASLSFAAHAQSNREDVDLIQSMFGKEKKMLMADFVQMDDGPNKDAFWKLYDEYEVKRKELGKKRIALLDKYVSNYATLDDATTTEIINETIKLSAQTDKLIATYTKKLQKAAGAKQAAQFYELESYILNSVRGEILENIPFIGELD